MRCISALLLFQITALSSEQDVHVEFLTAVPRLSSNTTVDYYFCCNVEGRFLQWQYGNQPLSGFLIDDIGRVFVDERLDYNYTATLLSSEPMDNNQAKMDSVLVLSFHNGTNPSKFNVTCSSNLNINSTTSGSMSNVKNSKGNEEVQLDYIVSDRVVSNRNKTYLFMCGVRNTPQFIELNGRIIGFSGFDDVGLARTIFLEDRSTADMQGILITRDGFESVTLVLVATISDVVNVSCYDSVSHFSLVLREEEESLESIPEPITGAKLATTERSMVSVAENSTELFYTPNDQFETSIIRVETVIIVNSIILSSVITIISISILIAIIVRRRIRKETKAFDECKQQSSQFGNGASFSESQRFELSQDETSFNNKAIADRPVTNLQYTSINMDDVDISDDRSPLIVDDMDAPEPKPNRFKKKAKRVNKEFKYVMVPQLSAEPLKPILTGNSCTVCCDGQQDKGENITLVEISEMKEGNNYCKRGHGIEENSGNIEVSIKYENNRTYEENSKDGWRVESEEENISNNEVKSNLKITQDELVNQDRVEIERVYNKQNIVCSSATSFTKPEKEITPLQVPGWGSKSRAVKIEASKLHREDEMAEMDPEHDLENPGEMHSHLRPDLYIFSTVCGPMENNGRNLDHDYTVKNT